MDKIIWLLAWAVWCTFIMILMLNFSIWFWLFVLLGPRLSQITAKKDEVTK